MPFKHIQWILGKLYLCIFEEIIITNELVLLSYTRKILEYFDKTMEKRVIKAFDGKQILYNQKTTRKGNGQESTSTKDT